MNKDRIRLTSCPPTLLRESDPAVSPDRRFLAFTRLSAYSLGQLNLLSLSSGLQPGKELQRLAPQLRAPLQSAWTPDGTAIVVSSEGALWRIPVSGPAEPERLPFAGEQLDISRRGHRMAFNLPSSDSKHLAAHARVRPAGWRFQALQWLQSERHKSRVLPGRQASRVRFESLGLLRNLARQGRGGFPAGPTDLSERNRERKSAMVSRRRGLFSIPTTMDSSRFTP